MNKQTIDFNYLRPPISLKSITHTDHYKKHGEGKKAVRKIFHDTDFDKFEAKNLFEFENLIKTEMSDIQFPSWWKQGDTLRFAYCQKFDMKKCLKALRLHLEWYQDPKLHHLDDVTMKYLKNGIFYQFGRDNQLRPIVIINVHQINLKEAPIDIYLMAMGHLFVMIERYMFYPGKIENWVILIETNNVGLLNFPFSILKKIIEATAINFTSRLEKLYILNPTMTLNASWHLISGLLDPDTSEKINFLKKSSFHQLQKNIAIDQLETKYGGAHPNLTEFWPPKNTLEEPPYIPENEQKKLEASAKEVMILDKNSEIKVDDIIISSKAVEESKPRLEEPFKANVDDLSKPRVDEPPKAKIDEMSKSKVEDSVKFESNSVVPVASISAKKEETSNRKLEPIAESTNISRKDSRRTFQINIGNQMVGRMSSNQKQLTSHSDDKHDEKVLNGNQTKNVDELPLSLLVSPLNNNNQIIDKEAEMRKSHGVSDETFAIKGKGNEVGREVETGIAGRNNDQKQISTYNQKPSEVGDDYQLLNEEPEYEHEKQDNKKHDHNKSHQEEQDIEEAKEHGSTDLPQDRKKNDKKSKNISYEGDDYAIKQYTFCGFINCKNGNNNSTTLPSSSASASNNNNNTTSVCMIF